LPALYGLLDAELASEQGTKKCFEFTPAACPFTQGVGENTHPQFKFHQTHMDV
jgi:hypothetical protein